VLASTSMGEVPTSVVLENGDDASLVQRGMLDPSTVRRVETEILVDADAINVLLPKLFSPKVR